MIRLLEVIALLIAALRPANRRQDFPDTAKAHGPQTLPAVETPRQTTPARAVETPRQTTPAPACATVPTGHARRASTPAPSSEPRGACDRGPPDQAAKSDLIRSRNQTDIRPKSYPRGRARRHAPGQGRAGQGKALGLKRQIPIEHQIES